MTHREAIKAYLKEICLTDMQVIDWGSGSKPAWRYIDQASSRNDWTTIDNAEGIPSDRMSHHKNLDINEPIELFQADVAFCLEVLEHVEYPESVLLNIWNNLKNGGQLFLSVPFKYRIHSDIDYWRFTDNGIRLLLERNGFTVNDIQETVDELGYIVEAVK